MIMKQVFLVSVLFTLASIANAQNREVTTAYNYGLKAGATQYAKAITAINKAVQHPETMENDKAWFYRGWIYQNVYQSSKPADRQLVENPLKEAIDSYKKAMQYKGKSDEWFNKAITNLNAARIQSFNEGIKFYEAKDYKKAGEYFEQSLSIGAMPEINQNEEPIYFNAGLSYELANELDKASEMFTLSVTNGYEIVASTGKIAEISLTKGDTVGYVNILKKGIDNIADNQELIQMLINYYLKANQTDEALDYINKAIQNDSNNKTLYFIQGTCYDKKGMVEEAFTAYTQALKIDANFVDATYNLGALYFNSGAEYNNKANDVPPEKEKEYDELRAKAAGEFEKSAQYFEKFLETQPNDIVVMQQLKQIYFQLRTKPEYAEKLKNIEAKILEAGQ